MLIVWRHDGYFAANSAIFLPFFVTSNILPEFPPFCIVPCPYFCIHIASIHPKFTLAIAVHHLNRLGMAGVIEAVWNGGDAEGAGRGRSGEEGNVAGGDERGTETVACEEAGQLEQHRAGMALHGCSERQEQHVLAVALVGAGGGGGGRGGRRGGGAGPRRVVAPRGRSLAPSVLLSLLVGLQRLFFCW